MGLIHRKSLLSLVALTLVWSNLGPGNALLASESPSAAASSDSAAVDAVAAGPSQPQGKPAMKVGFGLARARKKALHEPEGRVGDRLLPPGTSAEPGRRAPGVHPLVENESVIPDKKPLTFSNQAEEVSFSKSNLVDRPRKELFAIVRLQDLPEPTRELAAQLEILPLIKELNGDRGELSLERKAIIREEIIETVLESYFDAVSVQAEAQRELGQLAVLRQTLLDKRDRAVETNNAVNFIASGTLNTIGSILGFPKNALPFPGNFNQMLSGVVSTGMSMYALHQNNGGKTSGDGVPTVAAELFGRPISHHTSYPESVWRFFHSPSLTRPDKTRAEVFEQNWIERGWLEPHGSKREKLKLDIVCGVAVPHKAITIDDLNDQICIIGDISASASLMAHHLRDLLRMVDSDKRK